MPSSLEARPPRAAVEPVDSEIHGQRRSDPYRWLHDKDSARVLDHLRAENAYTSAIMAPTQALQDRLYREMLARIQETDMDVPYKDGAWEYYTRTEAGKSYPILCRRPVGTTQEQVTLDMNAMAAGHEFFALGAYDISPDANLLAFSTDVSGFREYTLQVKDLRSAEVLPLRVEKTRSVAWANDNRHLFYVTEDEAKRASRLYRHALGSDRHDLLYEETDDRFSIGIDETRSRGYLMLTASSATTSEVRYVPAEAPLAEFRLIAPRRAEHEYYADHHADAFWIVTNDRGRNFRLVSAPVGDPGEANWRECIPQREDVMLEGAELFARHCVLHERAGGFPRMRIMTLATGEIHQIEVPEMVCAVHGGANAEYDSDCFRFVYESLVTPDSVFDYDMNTRTRTLLKQRPVLGGYDASRFASELVYAKAADGTQVPVSMVYRRDTRTGGPQAMLLTGYGAYGYPHDVHFSSARLSLLERGVIVAVAHVRGGGEMGKRWHDEGRMLNKRNTFTDFIAAAERLIATGYTAPAKLIIEGGSAGGLLMGAVVNMRPDLFKAVIADVPFVDVMNTMLDPSLPLTTGEYEEWGDPNDPEYYRYMLSYSPYDNIAAHAYPTMLVQTSLNDSQVMVWEPTKYVAKLRATKTDDNVLLLKTNMDAGHGGASGRYDFLKEIAFTYAFVLWQLDIADEART